jgi:hypothetical protein
MIEAEEAVKLSIVGSGVGGMWRPLEQPERQLKHKNHKGAIAWSCKNLFMSMTHSEIVLATRRVPKSCVFRKSAKRFQHPGGWGKLPEY